MAVPGRSELYIGEQEVAEAAYELTWTGEEDAASWTYTFKGTDDPELERGHL